MKGFYKDKKVLVTGHTGFKGTWLCSLLAYLGADVIGYALQPPTNPSLFELIGLQKDINSNIGDIRDLTHLDKIFNQYRPEIVFHLAAQPIVLLSYVNPVYTYETNVMGTVNLLECVRKYDCVKSVVNVTTDKVYQNMEWEWGYRENETLNGFDPYSNSKSCSELVTSSYINSFLRDKSVAISTARAGNVIGGGDFAEDRIIPDCVRFIENNEKICIRNPYSVRPYQHVLDPLYAYLTIAMKQFNDNSFADCYNVGPHEIDCITTGELTTLFCNEWGYEPWGTRNLDTPHEAGFLKLDCSKIKLKLGWEPFLNIEQAISSTVEWTKCYFDNGNVTECMLRQIEIFLERNSVGLR